MKKFTTILAISALCFSGVKAQVNKEGFLRETASPHPSVEKSAEMVQKIHERQTARINKISNDSQELFIQQQASKTKENWWMPDTVTIWGYDGNFREILVYDEWQLLLSGKIEKQENEAWVNFEQYLYTYSATHKITHVLHQLADNGTWVNDWQETRTFNDKDSLVAKRHQMWVNENWQDGWTLDLVYDSNNDLVSDWYREYEDGVVIAGDRLTYTYNNNGPVSDTYERFLDGAWEYSWRWSYERDVNHRSTMETYQEWENNEWKNERNYLYEYDANGNMLVMIYQPWMDDAWVNGVRYSSEFQDITNFRTLDVTENWDNGAWVYEQQSMYYYDERGNDTLTIGQWYENDAFRNVGRRTCKFDSRNNRLLDFRELWRNDAWVGDVRITAIFNEFFSRTLYLQEMFENDEWIPVNQFVNEYDERNNQLSQKYQSWENNAWKTDNQILYEYDAGDNRTSIEETYFYEGEISFAMKSTFKYDNYGNGIEGEYFDWADGEWVPGYGRYITFNHRQCDYFATQFGYRMTVSYGQPECQAATNLDITITELTSSCQARITWTAPDENSNVSGYNVYRNGELIASGIEETVYIDEYGSTAEQEWCVASVCGLYESNPVCGRAACSVGSHEQKETPFSLYPNPANTLIFVKGEKIQKIEIYNSLGQLVDSRSAKPDFVDVANYRAGIYFFKVFTANNQPITKQVLVTH